MAKGTYKGSKSKTPPTPMQGLIRAAAWPIAVVATAFGCPGAMALPVCCLIARLAARGVEYDAKDPWGRARPTDLRGDASYRKAKNWLSDPNVLLPTSADAAVSAGLACLSCLPVRGWAGILQFLGAYVWLQAFWAERRDRTLTAEGRDRGIRQRRTKWARRQVPAILRCMLPAIPVGVIAAALTGLVPLAFAPALLMSAIPMRRAHKAARRQADLDYQAAGLVWKWAEGMDKAVTKGRPGSVMDTRRGANGEWLFTMATPSGAREWATQATTLAFAPQAQADGLDVGFALDGMDERRVAVAVATTDMPDLGALMDDETGLAARMIIDEVRVGACYSATPGKVSGLKAAATRDGHVSCRSFDLNGTNADWSNIDGDWLKGSADPKFGDWMGAAGLVVLVDPSGHGWIAVDDDWRTMEFDEKACARLRWPKAQTPRDDRSMATYMEVLQRTKREKAKWSTAASAFKLSPPVTLRYADETTYRAERGWSLTRLPMTLGGDGSDVTAWMKADFRPVFGDSLVADILPTRSGNGWSRRILDYVHAGRAGNMSMPDALRDLDGCGPAERLLARVLVSRAFANTLKRPAFVSDPRQCLKDGCGTLWRVDVELFGGVTAADARKGENHVRALAGADVALWEWIDDSHVVLWAGDRIPPDVSDWRSGRLYGKAMTLRLSQCWAQAGAVSRDGRSVETAELGPGPNGMVRAVFTLPAGLSMDKADAATSTFMDAAGYGYMKPFDVDAPGRFGLLLAERDPLPDRLLSDWSQLDPSHPRRVPFGLKDDGSPAIWDVSKTPHLLASGTTGSGKSSVSVTCALAMLRLGWQVAVTDPSKGANDFRPIRDRLIAFEDSLEGCYALLQWAEGEMKRRARLIKENGGGDFTILPDGVRPKPLLLFIDETNSLLGEDERPLPNPNDDPELENANIMLKWRNGLRHNIGLRLSHLLTQARSAGIAVLLGAQQLKAGSLDALPAASTCKEMLGRVFLGNGETAGNISTAHVREANRMLRQAGSMPKGRGLYEPMGGGLDMVQCWWSGMGDDLVANAKGIPAAEPIDLSDHMPVRPDVVGAVDEPAEEAIEEDLSFGDDFVL